MRITIYQPQYFPRLHYFNRIFNADVFVVLSSAQYTKGLNQIENGVRKRHKSYQSDTPIRYVNGIYNLTVPTFHSGLLPINKTGIVYTENWPVKHLATIRTYYAKSPYLHNILPSLQELLSRKYESLAELNLVSTLWGIAHCLDIPLTADQLSIEIFNDLLYSVRSLRLNQIIDDSDTGIIRPQGKQKGTEWTTAICQKLGATEYYFGGTAQEAYMDINYYNKFGITPKLQEWKCPEYKQLYEDHIPFIANLSIIDLLCNLKPRDAQDLLGISKINTQYAIPDKPKN
jgi:hypothetical protein